MWPVPKSDEGRRDMAFYATIIGYLMHMRAARYGVGLLAWLIYPEYWAVIVFYFVFIAIVWEIDNSEDSTLATALRHVRRK